MLVGSCLRELESPSDRLLAGYALSFGKQADKESVITSTESSTLCHCVQYAEHYFCVLDPFKSTCTQVYRNYAINQTSQACVLSRVLVTFSYGPHEKQVLMLMNVPRELYIAIFIFQTYK